MTLTTDSYYHIGAAHLTAGRPCQDYAASHSFSSGEACAIVSDGCSTAGQTDVGARLVALATIESLKRQLKLTGCAEEDFVALEACEIFSSIRDTLGLLPEDMLATRIYCYLDSHGGYIDLHGDGVAAIKYRNGGLVLHRFDWANNAPFYPAYTIEDSQRYIAKLHSGKTDTAILTQCIASKNEAGKWEEARELLPFEVGMPGYSISISRGQLEDLEFVAVFSDGVTQIGKVSSGEDMLDWREIVADFMAFKATAGDFAKRRMLRGIRDLHKQGYGPIDDIGYAVIHIQQ